MMLFWICTLLIISRLSAVGASGYSKLCPLSGSPIIQLEYDPNTQQLTVVKSNFVVEEGGGTRSLQDETIQFGKHLSSNTFRGAQSHRLAETTTKYTARQCPCDATGTTYCIIDSAISAVVPDTCGVPQSSDFLFGVSNYPYSYSNSTHNNSTIECFGMAHQTVFIRNAWPVILLWYGALVVFFFATANGKYVQLCLINSICPCFRVNERYVDRVLQQEDEMRSRLRRWQAAAERASNIADGPGRFLRRTRGMRLMRHLHGEELSEVNQREQAMARWIQAAETYGISNAREVSDQPMEYALRTRKFDAMKERERRNGHRIENESETNNNSTPIKLKKNFHDKGGNQGNEPNTPETVATNDSEGSRFDFNDEDNLVDGSSTANDVDLEAGTLEHNNEPSDVVDSETFDCTICLSEVCDGEVVGVLTCSHIFHVDCLREWMLRRNACPLCQTEICTPRPVESDTAAARQISSLGEADASSGNGVGTERTRTFVIADSLPNLGLDLTEIRDPIIISGNTDRRPYIITTSLPDLDVREPSIRRNMSGTMSPASRRDRIDRGRARRQPIEDPFSFSGW